MIVLHEYPLTMVDHIGFRKFTATLQPNFELPTRIAVKNDILGIYDYERSKVMKILKKSSSRVAIKADMWRFSDQKKGFMAITAHFIDNSWTLQDYVLRFVYLPYPHTNEIVAKALADCLTGWNIDMKLSTITLGNFTDNDSLVEVVNEKWQDNRLLNDGAKLCMHCCSHILNLIVNDGLDVIKNVIESVRDSVVYWTATRKRKGKFARTVRELPLPYTKKLGLDCPIRWTSTYLMLQTAILYKDAFARLSQCESQYKCLPSEEDWKLAQQICEHLEFFYACTELFSRTSYPTASMYFRKICQIKLAMTEWLASESELIRRMAGKMLEKYDKYWSTVHEMMGVAAILDPRYKMSFLEFYFPKVFGVNYREHIAQIRRVLDDLMHGYQLSRSLSNTGSKKSLTKPVKSGSSVLGKRSYCDDDDELASFLESRNAARGDDVISELEYYLKDECWPDSEGFDILHWWSTSGSKFPILQAIARDLLAIPVSTLASECAFSSKGRLVSPHRSNLFPKTIEALMCAQSWLRSYVRKVNPKLLATDGYASIYEDIESDHDPELGICDGEHSRN